MVSRASTGESAVTGRIMSARGVQICATAFICSRFRRCSAPPNSSETIVKKINAASLKVQSIQSLTCCAGAVC
jgi:hypothetical protein